MSKSVDMEWLTFKDGTTGARFGLDDVRESMAESWEYATTPVDTSIAWQVDSGQDSDDLEDGESILVEVGTLAELVRLARIGAQYAGCSVCRRVTVV